MLTSCLVCMSRGVVRNVFVFINICIFAFFFALNSQATESENADFSALEKPDDHIVTSLSCDQCHLDPADENFEFVHQPSTQDQCYRCHDGSSYFA